MLCCEGVKVSYYIRPDSTDIFFLENGLNST